MSKDMMPREYYSSDDLLEVFRQLGVEAEYHLEIDDDDGDVSYHIECELGDLKFRCSLELTEPLFEEARLISVRPIVESPYRFLNRFSEGRRFAHIRVLKDDDGEVSVDPDGNFWLGLTLIIPFEGGVTPQHLAFLINMWLEDLIDFYEIDDEDLDELTVSEPSIVPGTPLERIESCLSVLGPQTARQLAHNLDSTKNEVNAILYKHPQLFAKSKDQPPLWSLIET